MATMEFLKIRAQEFRDNAQLIMERDKFALAAFNIEQAVKLELKYFIGSRLGDFPRTHSLKTLFQECLKVCRP